MADPILLYLALRMRPEHDFYPQMRGMDLGRQARMDRYRLDAHDRLCELLVERDKQIEGLKETSDILLKMVLVACLAVAYIFNVFNFWPESASAATTLGASASVSSGR